MKDKCAKILVVLFIISCLVACIEVVLVALSVKSELIVVPCFAMFGLAMAVSIVQLLEGRE